MDKDYSLFVDHYHNFVALDIYLAKRSTYIGGNLRSDRRGNIHAWTLVTVEFVWRRSGNVVICKWKDKRDVLPISNKNTNPEMVSVSNTLGDQKQKPSSVCDYNYGMSGIDHTDQMLWYIFQLYVKLLDGIKKLVPSFIRCFYLIHFTSRTDLKFLVVKILI